MVRGRLGYVFSVLVALGGPEATSIQWKPRADLGIAAVDRRTGSILWEAWDESDLPARATADVRSAARRLFAERESGDADSPDPGFPVPLGPDRVVKYLYSSDLNRIVLILSRGSETSPGEEFARFSFGNTPASFARGNGILYVLAEGRLHALTPRGAQKDGTWLPDWSFDLVDLSAGRERAPMQLWILRVEGDDLWVADPKRIRRFSSAGRLESDHGIANPWLLGLEGFNAALTLGDRLVYYRHPVGVIAVDRETSLEIWRVPTWRSPYPSRVREVDPLVLVQVGSNCPQTILGALREGSHPLPMLGPNTPRRFVAATALLRAYGDGYPGAGLRKWMTRVGRGKQDSGVREATLAIEHLLENWPAKRDRQRLIDFSVDSLLAAPESRPSPSSPAVDRTLTWTLLQELIYGKSPDGYGRPGMNYAFDTWDENFVPLSEARKPALVAECRRVLAGGPAAVQGLAASVLLSRSVGWGSLSDAELTALFLSPHDSVWRWAGMSLAKHGRRDELVELAGRRPPGEHLSVIYMLANILPPELSAGEKRFWIACLTRTPGSIAYVLDLTRSAELPREYREPIRAYLVDTLRRAQASPATPPNETTQREYDANAALRVLDRWRDPEDTPVFASYLGYPHPFVRQQAKALLDDRQLREQPAAAPP